MEKKQRSIQCLLLIDTYRPDDLNDNDVVNKYRALTLSSFRILNRLQSSIQSLDESTEIKQKIRQDGGLKWTFKFFSSRSHKSAVKQEKLRDFKLKYFEQYEAKLDERLQNPSEKVGKSSKINASECLQKALTEIVTDIEWEMPDIASPMKGRRHTKQQQPSRNQNYVFLFTKLPSNSQEMRTFAGKRVLDSEILLDAIMPPHLLEQFCHHAKLSLFWVDISSLNTSAQNVNCSGAATEVQCIEIITKTLKHVGGLAFKIDSLINMGHSDTWSLGKFSQSKSSPGSQNEQAEDSKVITTNEVNKKCNNCSNPFPSIFPSDTIIESLSVVSHRQNLLNKDSEMLHSHHIAVLQLAVGESIENVSLKLESTSISSLIQENESHGMMQSNTSAVLTPPTKSNPRLVHIHLDKGSSLQTDVTVLQSKPGNHSLSQKLELKIHSCMSKSAMSLCSMVGSSCFQATVDGQGEIIHQNLFEDLLSTLKKKNKMLVLTVKSGGQACPHLAVMDTLTSHSALISVLPLGATLQVEKACLAQTEKSSTTSEVANTNSSLSKLNAACLQECSVVKAKISTRIQHKKHKETASGGADPSQCYNPQILNSWHLPGTSRGLPSLISKLNNRLQDLDFLTVEEKQTLKALQKMYRKENQPQALLQKSHPHTDTSHTDKPEIDSEDIQDPVQVGKPGNAKFNRGKMMVKRSKAAVKRRSKTEEEVVTSQVEKQTDRLQIKAVTLDLQTEESLGQYLKEVYSKALEQGEGLETCVQNMVTVTVHFQKEKGDNPEIQAVELLRREVVLSTSALREKYLDKTSDTDKVLKITEYKLQVLLLLEMESAVLSADESHIEKCVDEVVNLLRTLSFITDSGVVSNFLNKVIITSYVPTLPQLLVSVYDELMQPLPESLAMFASPNKSADSTVLNNSLKSPDSICDPGSQPGSNKSDILQSSRTLRTRRLVQHPSLSDYGSKKQIMVMKKPTAVGAAKPKEKAKEKEKIKRQKSAQPATKPKKSKAKPDIVKVRRNLFEGDKPKLERRQSVAVMERTKKSPHKKLTDVSFRSPKATKSPGAKRRSVAETPAHKQMSNAVWHRLEKKRKRTSSEEEVEVVQESPMKQLEDNFKKVSPSRNKHAMNMMRRSFYSAGPRNRSRNLTKYFQFADKIAGRQQRLSLGDMSGPQARPQLPHKSPSRSSFLMSQLMCSPSPRNKTPGKSCRLATATTPKHTVQESPFRNTRSKTPKKFSKVLLFDSPKKEPLQSEGEELSKLTNSPTKHHRTPRKQAPGNILCAESPGRITRSHTPNKIKSPPSNTNLNPESSFTVSPHDIRIPSTPKRTPHRPTSTPSLLSPPPAPPLTPQRSILKSSQSSTKRLFELPSTPQRTPKLSRGLVAESPSQNTRSQNSTPSRTSVCTALFSPSARATPRSKLFIGADLQGETRSPKRRVHFDNIEDPSSKQSEPSNQQSNENSATPHTPQKNLMLSLTSLSFVNKDGSVTSLCVKTSPSVSRTESKSSDVQRTPSPQKQQKVKTPDSFDKWPRRKRRWTSPTQSKNPKENISCSLAEDENSQKENSVSAKSDGQEVEDSQELKRRVSTVSRKRSFLESVQDSSTVYSSNKRSKTSWTDSLSSKDTKDRRYYCLHQHVSSVTSASETLPSSINSSQTSTSGLDYFSPINDEVFLTGDSQDLPSVTQEESFKSKLSHLSSRSSVHSVARSESPVFGSSPSVARLLQDQYLATSPASQGFEVDEEPVPSPKFQTSPVFAAANKTSKDVSASKTSPRHTPRHSPAKFLSPDTKSGQISPSALGLSISPDIHPRTSSVAASPRDRKFSPSVSARSLVHLMNSPLIKPDENPFHSPGKTKVLPERPHFKSRKSLNMQK